MSEFNKIAKESSINFTGSFVGNILNYIWLMILTRYLSQEDLGNFTLAQSLVNISLIFVLLGMHQALDRFIPFFNSSGHQGKIKSLLRLIFQFSLTSSLLMGLILYWGADFLSVTLFKTPALTEILRIVLLSIPLLAAITVVIYAFIGHKELRYNVYLKQLLEPGLRILIASAVAIWGLGVLAWSWLYLLSLLVSALAGIWLLYRNILHPLAGIDREKINIKEIIAYSWPISIASILIILIGQIDYLIIGIYHPSADIGVYRIYIQIAALLKLILGSTARIYKPVISELIPEGGFDTIRITYQRVSKWVLALTLLGFIIIALFGEELTGWLFTEAYSIYPAALTILVLGTLINASFGPDGATLEAFGNTRLVLINSLVALFVNIGLGFWLIPDYGIVGAAISTAATLSLSGLMGLIEILLLYKIQPYTAASLKILAVGLTVGGLFWGIRSWLAPGSAVVVLIMIGLLTGLYGTGFLLSRSLDAEDRELLTVLWKRITPREN